MTNRFTWIPLYRDLATRLGNWENRQSELIQLLEKLRELGNVVTPLKDRDASGDSFLLTEIDPFTFFGTFNRSIRHQERLAILAGVKQLLGSSEPLPDDFDGLPTLNNQKSWFIDYKSKRGADDVTRLWRVFKLALEDHAIDNPQFATAFDAAIEVRNTNVNLTMGLFWIRPNQFLNLDSTNRDFLKVSLPWKGLSAEFYIKTIKTVTAGGRSLTDISADAWKALQEGPSSKGTTKPNVDHWLVGAYFDNNDPPDQTERFMAEAVWENGYKDKYIDEVKSMKVGDKIAIKSSYVQRNNLPFDAGGKSMSCMLIKAAGTVVANRGDGRTVEVEWDKTFKPKAWYFFVYQGTVWKLRLDADYRNREYAQRLIEFIWGNQAQDYAWFCSRLLSPATPDGGSAVFSGEDAELPGAVDAYSIDDLMALGTFLPKEELELMLSQLKADKNLILQGAPGVGKTFLARGLAYTLMEEKTNDRIEFIQFHQTFSYEDFVRGYRPSSAHPGTFDLNDGVFLRFCQRAAADLDRKYVFIVDEINRGNLSQIFGDLLMLIEGDKRGSDHQIELLYRRAGEGKFFIPPNLYILGMMNLADRSIAVVDYALRRRFAFVTLRARFDSTEYKDWLVKRSMSDELVALIISRMCELNAGIASDPLLGENFEVGHSVFCPKGNDFSGLTRSWYEGIIKTKVAPLLKEYWFDNSVKSREAVERLLAK